MSFGKRNTKIVATLGPASTPHDMLEKLVLAGVNVFRLNFSHVSSTPDNITSLSHPLLQVVNDIREISAKHNHQVAILGDLQGPKFRTRVFETPIELDKGVDFYLDCAKTTQDQRNGKYTGDNGQAAALAVVTTPNVEIVSALRKGDRVLFDDGNLSAVVTDRVSSDRVICATVNGGLLKSRKGINVPDLEIPVPALTAKDKLDARFMLFHELDWVALSFVQRGQDVKDLREWFDHLNTNEFASTDSGTKKLPCIVAKIEKPQALENMEGILDQVDGIMVARGDLGVELSLEQVPIAQKELIQKCNQRGVPVITATQMFESMIENPVPTRAEVSDVSNAVIDGSDAVMLSGETSVGKHVVGVVEQMSRVCEATEGHSFTHSASNRKLQESASFSLDRRDAYKYKNPKASALNLNLLKQSEFKPTHEEAARTSAVAMSAVWSAKSLKAKAIVVFTLTGDMCYRISSLRLFGVPVIAVSPFAHVARQVCISFGVFSCVVPMQYSSDDWAVSIEAKIKELGWLKDGDLMVFACGNVGLSSMNCVTSIRAFGDATRHRQARNTWGKTIQGVLHKSHEK